MQFISRSPNPTPSMSGASGNGHHNQKRSLNEQTLEDTLVKLQFTALFSGPPETHRASATAAAPASVVQAADPKVHGPVLLAPLATTSGKSIPESPSAPSHSADQLE